MLCYVCQPWLSLLEKYVAVANFKISICALSAIFPQTIRAKACFFVSAQLPLPSLFLLRSATQPLTVTEHLRMLWHVDLPFFDFLCPPLYWPFSIRGDTRLPFRTAYRNTLSKMTHSWTKSTLINRKNLKTESSRTAEFWPFSVRRLEISFIIFMRRFVWWNLPSLQNLFVV